MFAGPRSFMFCSVVRWRRVPGVTYCSVKHFQRQFHHLLTTSRCHTPCLSVNIPGRTIDSDRHQHLYGVPGRVQFETFCRQIVTRASDANQVTKTLQEDVPDTSDLNSERLDEEANPDVDDEAGVSHVPVMVEEVIEALQPMNGQVIVDMTFGAGGHAREIIKAAPEVHYFASDRDMLAHEFAVKFADENRHTQVTPLLGRFSELPVNLHKHNVQPGTVDAFLFDLGVSSMQFDRAERGFSLSQDGPLDMRMDGNRVPTNPTAADVVNSLETSDLAHILKKYGEERKSLQVAQAIVEARYAFGNFTRTRQLADVISTVFHSEAFGLDKMSRNAHVATKSFQALRIFVNNELNEIHNGLLVARHYLKPGGVCVVIAFHSLEDRIVKRHFMDIDIDESSNLSIHDHFRNASVSFNPKQVQEDFMVKLWEPLSRKVQTPSEGECLRNPRARSAKLRAARKM